MADLKGITNAVHGINARDVTIANFAGGFKRFAIDIPIIGVGESTTQVWFPSLYVEKPLHSFGFEVVGGSNIPDGAIPMASVLIRSWNTEIAVDSDLTMYKGCRVTAKTVMPFANSNDAMFIRFGFSVFFEGRAISMPGRRG